MPKQTRKINSINNNNSFVTYNNFSKSIKNMFTLSIIPQMSFFLFGSSKNLFSSFNELKMLFTIFSLSCFTIIVACYTHELHRRDEGRSRTTNTDANTNRTCCFLCVWGDDEICEMHFYSYSESASDVFWHKHSDVDTILIG